MKTPLPDYLAHVIDACDTDNSGRLADYIPELANANPNRLALALSTVDGEVYSVGDDEIEFTIQSMSKPFTYAYVLQSSNDIACFVSYLARVRRSYNLHRRR